ARALQLSGGQRQQRVLTRVPRRVRGRQDTAASAGTRVLGHLAELRDVAKLVRPAELAPADRPCIRVGERDEPIRDLQPTRAAIDLLRDPLAAAGQPLERRGRAQLLTSTTPARGCPQRASKRASLTRRAPDQLPGALVQRQHLLLRLA